MSKAAQEFDPDGGRRHAPAYRQDIGADIVSTMVRTAKGLLLHGIEPASYHMLEPCQAWISVPTGSPASARVRLPGTRPLTMRMLLASFARVSNSSTTGSIGSVGKLHARSDRRR